ncbi:MAG: septum formation inhibitor Maf [Syntrophomonadaceae bacterium]|nr:septum formation inhibitor Maf [Syntrophomonadaceae bacterium]
MTRIILASESPRRRQLLETMGIDFSCLKPQITEELITGESALQTAERLALQKALSISDAGEDCLIIAADTIVTCAGKILGKPGSAEEACKMLSLLSGRSHQVITAVCVKKGLDTEVQSEITKVFFRTLNRKEILGYIATGEPFDKAGGYGIQGIGSVLVDRIEGCYFNVVGLPLSRLYKMLQKQNIEVLGV